MRLIAGPREEEKMKREDEKEEEEVEEEDDERRTPRGFRGARRRSSTCVAEANPGPQFSPWLVKPFIKAFIKRFTISSRTEGIQRRSTFREIRRSSAASFFVRP